MQKTILFPPVYKFELIKRTIKMPDGVELAVSYFKPIQKEVNEKFPVVLEMLPYRKDDSFCKRDYPIFSYLARRGIAGARVDIRGTGSSGGKLPEREYSDIELDDIVYTIDYLSKLPWSNGNIGMQGNSWSSFNALMIAMRRPEKLKAILILHGSEDLYYNDIHFIDGALHVNNYALEIDTENPVPQSPDYPVDEEYFRNRFDTEPWIFTYIRQQRDGEWWRKGRSAFTNYKSIDIPVYCIGGLLDGYRDYVPNLIDNLDVHVKAEIGPWNHDYPHKGYPGPRYEGRQSFVRWWNQWLNNIDTGILNEPDLTVFMRGVVPADISLEETTGEFWNEKWPIERTEYKDFYLASNRKLTEEITENESENSLKYIPDIGVEAGMWWAETSGDMSNFDKGCLVYDTEPFLEKKHILGFPKIKLKISVDAPQANFFVRLENVHPDGTVSLITGALRNGTHRESRLNPKFIVPNKLFELEIPLHFTTWTFEKGHKMRISISNAQYPMIWPSPYNMTMKLLVNCESAKISLPFVEKKLYDEKNNVMLLPEELELPECIKYYDAFGPDPFTIDRNEKTGITTAKTALGGDWKINNVKYHYREDLVYHVNTANPAEAGCKGEGTYTINMSDRKISVNTIFEIKSDLEYFYVNAKRKLYENGNLIREKNWPSESIPRDFQ